MKKILIVDDDHFILNMLDAALTTENYETVRAYNGKEALAEMLENEFDAVITDIRMPEKDGISFVNEMRAQNIQTPVIAISGDKKGGQKADEALGFACYFAADVMEKPVQKEDLLTVLKLAIGERDKE
jgi:two-component system response regulator HydG